MNHCFYRRVDVLLEICFFQALGKFEGLQEICELPQENVNLY
jgi:hypothetical protein